MVEVTRKLYLCRKNRLKSTVSVLINRIIQLSIEAVPAHRKSCFNVCFRCGLFLIADFVVPSGNRDITQDGPAYRIVLKINRKK